MKFKRINCIIIIIFVVLNVLLYFCNDFFTKDFVGELSLYDVLNVLGIISLILLFFKNVCKRVELFLAKKTKPLKEILDYKFSVHNNIYLGCCLCLSLFVAIGLFLENYYIGKGVVSENQQSLNKNIQDYFLCTVIIAPICEEMVFRWLPSRFIRLYEGKACKRVIFILFAMVLPFALLHFNKNEEICILIPYFLSGIYFTIAFLLRGNILDSILLHALVNSLNYINFSSFTSVWYWKACLCVLYVLLVFFIPKFIIYLLDKFWGKSRQSRHC